MEHQSFRDSSNDKLALGCKLQMAYKQHLTSHQIQLLKWCINDYDLHHPIAGNIEHLRVIQNTVPIASMLVDQLGIY